MNSCRLKERIRRFESVTVLVVVTLLVLIGATGRAAAEPDSTRGSVPGRRAHPGPHQAKVYTYVPPPEEIYGRQGPYFYGKERIEVPGTVAVNKPPYVCDLDEKTFKAKAAFLGHLQVKHGGLLRRNRAPFVVYEGQVHFVRVLDPPAE
jgi:hypothetical protein